MYAALKRTDDTGLDVIIHDAPTLQYAEKNDIDLQVVGTLFEEQDYGIAMQFDSIMTTELNIKVQQLDESGALGAMIAEWISVSSVASTSLQLDAQDVTGGDLVGLLLIFCIGAGISLIVWRITAVSRGEPALPTRLAVPSSFAKTRRFKHARCVKPTVISRTLSNGARIQKAPPKVAADGHNHDFATLEARPHHHHEAAASPIPAGAAMPITVTMPVGASLSGAAMGTSAVYAADSELSPRHTPRGDRREPQATRSTRPSRRHRKGGSREGSDGSQGGAGRPRAQADIDMMYLPSAADLSSREGAAM